jgi:hypothetical protein
VLQFVRPGALYIVKRAVVRVEGENCAHRIGCDERPGCCRDAACWGESTKEEMRHETSQTRKEFSELGGLAGRAEAVGQPLFICFGLGWFKPGPPSGG